jgi:hypothetical protein
MLAELPSPLARVPLNERCHGRSTDSEPQQYAEAQVEAEPERTLKQEHEQVANTHNYSCLSEVPVDSRQKCGRTAAGVRVAMPSVVAGVDVPGRTRSVGSSLNEAAAARASARFFVEHADAELCWCDAGGARSRRCRSSTAGLDANAELTLDAEGPLRECVKNAEDLTVRHRPLATGRSARRLRVSGTYRNPIL